ncbi:MAG: pyruvate dehydrogenase (acetyl-transferring) E1 component subunit alpha [Acidobacteria bacterium]|nr:pyruvate dehydrogenase (acetyl-transferring) E1 component subunit alpha [Acidobacteriota bacterium]
MLQILDYEGRVILAERLPKLSPEEMVTAYQNMLYARTADQMAVSYQRQGRMYTYPPNLGQEAIGVAVGSVMREDDWLVPAYRELSAWLAKGASMKDIFLYFGGHEDGSVLAGAKNMLPSAVPIASQLPHAAGIGYAMKYQGKKDIVFTFVGDGGTSQGDFHEALNFAGVWRAPVVFIIQNNQYAISHPRAHQTAAKSLAVKAEGYGIPGIQVDGNDYLAMVAAVKAAAEHARAGQGPVLIEAVTYRRGAHTTSDDPGRYRTEAEEQKWAERDPLKRLKGYLLAQQLWDETNEEPLISQYKKEIDQQFTEMENHPYDFKDIFIHHYTEIPDDLKQQMVAYEKFLNWKESQQ